MLRHPVAALLLLAACSTAGAALADGNAATGHSLARHWCTGCHVVDAKGSGSDTVPSFAAIANDPQWTPQRIGAFLAKPHPPMPNPPLSTAEIDDLTAYIGTLRSP